MKRGYRGGTKRLCALALVALIVAGVLAGCGKKEPALPEDRPPVASEAIRLIEERGGGEPIEDTATLQAIWEDYLYPTTFTIANYKVAIQNLGDIPLRELTDYLRDRMYWNGDTEGLDRDEYTPVEMLEAYCVRYFGDAVDFRENRPDMWYIYDADTDRAGSGNLIFERRDATAYDDLKSWPETALDSVVRYPEGWLVAYCTSYASTDVPEDRFAARKAFLLREREDGSLYILGSSYAFVETNRLTVTGEAGAAAGFDPAQDTRLVMAGEETGMFLLRWNWPNGDVAYGLWDALKGGSPDAGYRFSADGTEAGRIIYEGPLGDGYMVLTGHRVVTFDKNGQVRVDNALPAWLAALVGDDPYNVLSRVRFSPDFMQATLCESEGIRIYDQTGVYTVVPGTASTYDAGNIMRGESYGTADFVAGGTRLFCRKYGYESTSGFLLYDLQSGESRYYDYPGGYGMQTQMDDAGCYIAGYYRGSEPGEPIYIDFATGEERPAPEFEASELEMMYNVRLLQGGADGYNVMMEETEPPADAAAYESRVSYRVTVRQNSTGETRDTGCVIMAPRSAVIKAAATQDGRAILQAEYLGELIAVVTK